jgi:hypothetical protein
MLISQAFFLFFTLVLSGSDKKTFGLHLPQSTRQPSSQPKWEGRRRDFLASVIQGAVLTQSKPAFALITPDEKIATNQNYVYRENWVGTNLQLLSTQQAASISQNDFEMGRWPDSILRRTANKIDDSLFGGEILKSVAQKLRRTARVNQAVGLAAQQW